MLIVLLTIIIFIGIAFIPKKTIAGILIAGSLLGGILTSCNNKPDSFKKEKIECVAADKITDSISVKTLPAKNKLQFQIYPYRIKHLTPGA